MERSARPLVGVTTQTLQAIDGIPGELPSSWVMNQRYLRALAETGAAPVLVPLLAGDTPALRGLYERLDGLFLPGGVDVDPATYGEQRSPLCGNTDRDRDVVEAQLVKWAVADGLPFLGVCRGIHILNVALGGTLYQDCAAEYPGAIKHDYMPTAGHARDYLAHEIRIEADTRLGEIFDSAVAQVNSMHHQGVRRLASGLRISASAPDGLVEAVETENQAFQLAVQWHPEMLLPRDDATGRLFRDFVTAARHYAAAGPVGAGT